MLQIAFERDSDLKLRHLIGEGVLTIGRAPDNTIKLPDLEISRHHCRMEWKNGVLFLRDLSTNGTLLNGTVCAKAEVRAGDRISIGPWTLFVERAAGEIPAKTIISSPSQTKIISFDAKEKKLTKECIEIEVRSPDGAPIKKKFSTGEVIVGQHASCDISIADPYVSRRHCKLSIENGAVKLTDLSSTNGTYIDNIRINETILPPEGSFCAGKTTILYRVERSIEKVLASKKSRLGGLVGVSREMREIFSVIQMVGPSDSTVLITGESGTGKEVVARELHNASVRQTKPFIAINCGSIPSTIIESQLFGHERGSFTGAVERMAGFFEQARGGTIFLDEIGEMPLEMQSRLLRVLETKIVRRVGGQEDIPVDARVICATNRNLKELVASGKFREDLFHRIFVIPIHIPPLRSRVDDIKALAVHFVSLLNKDKGKTQITRDALDKLTRHEWRGNVRELKNTLERSILLAGGSQLTDSNLKILEMDEAPNNSNRLRDREREAFITALNECGSNLSRLARRLGIARTTAQKRLKKYGLTVAKEKE